MVNAVAIKKDDSLSRLMLLNNDKLKKYTTYIQLCLSIKSTS